MSEGYLEVVAVRHDTGAPGGETTVVRLLGLLPAHWACVPEVSPGRVRLRIYLDGTGGTDAVHGVVDRVFSDRALHGWRPEC